MYNLDEYMEQFFIKENGTLLDIFKRKTAKLDQSSTDTNKRLKIRLELLKMYYGEMKMQHKFNEDEYQTIVNELTKNVNDAFTQS